MLDYIAVQVMWSCKMFAMLRSFVLPVTVLRYRTLKRLATQAVTNAYTRGSAQMCSVFRIRWSYIVCVGFCSFMLPVRDVQHLTLNGLRLCSVLFQFIPLLIFSASCVHANTLMHNGQSMMKCFPYYVVLRYVHSPLFFGAHSLRTTASLPTYIVW
jgi:hypothetical protein